MDTTFLSLPKPFTTLTPIAPAAHHRLPRPLKFSPIRNNGSSSSSSSSNNTSSDAENPLPAVQAPITPPDRVEIRFRRGSRRRSRQKNVASDGMPKKVKALAPKDWEAMTMTEKAVELYMGEKGLLFWLNKLAYASIFIIIGGWILFRFVGPALNLYQLDSVPQSPSSMFKGS